MNFTPVSGEEYDSGPGPFILLLFTNRPFPGNIHQPFPLSRRRRSVPVQLYALISVTLRFVVIIIIYIFGLIPSSTVKKKRARSRVRAMSKCTIPMVFLSPE